ncbi:MULTISPECIES: hypothetical protein [Clostridium]|uniref:Uncharacterized protein n=1 Tax=Clostridium cibarium TaxID=2762247 RepID=A0ABR8PW76_9CLOT|nr:MULTISPECIES: hypothetical protein [Clostridium]MBD7912383.1 hypothetical protein [Clostridium cibarium]
MEKPSPSCKSIIANCRLDVNFDPKNKIIYVCSGKPQYFTATSSKCNGPITITYTGRKYDPCTKKICGDLGVYTTYDSGIVLDAYNCIRPGTMDTLSFTADDGCTCYKFTVIFVYSPCDCYNTQTCCNCNK